ncbi:MAG: hypothetical protein QOK05_2680 [Chloroflexota bacterium]|jgi:hypothetical protein|nr:hypothetical protein [Chloroflexota bacterium]
MRIRKIVHKPVKLDREGIHLAGGIDAVINANIGGSGSQSSTTSHQVTRIVQKGRRSRTDTGDQQEKEVEP